jgi:uncharacterized protein
VGTLTIVLAGVGVWLLIEGALCALAPDFMRGLGARLAELPRGDLAQAGLWAAALGGLIVFAALRLT